MRHRRSSVISTSEHDVPTSSPLMAVTATFDGTGRGEDMAHGSRVPCRICIVGVQLLSGGGREWAHELGGWADSKFRCRRIYDGEWGHSLLASYITGSGINPFDTNYHLGKLSLSIHVCSRNSRKVQRIGMKVKMFSLLPRSMVNFVYPGPERHA